MEGKKFQIDSIAAAILPILKTEGVIRSSLFGSFVRSEETSPSDVDILVELPEEKSLLDLINLEHKLEDALNRDVDLVTYRSIPPRLLPYIERDQVQIL